MTEKEEIKTIEEGGISIDSYKEYSITIEPMFVGKDLKQTMVVKLLNPETQKYVMFQAVVTKSSPLGKEVESILKSARKTFKK